MEFYSKTSVNSEFEIVCDKILVGLYSAGFRALVENNLQNQLFLELGINTFKWKVIGGVNFPIDLISKNPFNELGNLIHFKLMVYEVHERKTQISALEPIIKSSLLQNIKFNKLILEAKERVSGIVDHIGTIKFRKHNNKGMGIFYSFPGYY